jgi:hypothetical protein
MFLKAAKIIKENLLLLKDHTKLQGPGSDELPGTGNRQHTGGLTLTVHLRQFKTPSPHIRAVV